MRFDQDLTEPNTLRKRPGPIIALHLKLPQPNCIGGWLCRHAMFFTGTGAKLPYGGGTGHAFSGASRPSLSSPGLPVIQVTGTAVQLDPCGHVRANMDEPPPNALVWQRATAS